MNNRTVGLSNSKTIDELQNLYNNIPKIKSAFQDFFDALIDLNKNYTQNVKKETPYAILLKEMQQNEENLSADVEHYRNAYQSRLEIDNWYLKEYKKIQSNKAKLSKQDQSIAFADLNTLYEERAKQADEQVWQERGQKLGSIVGDGLKDILKEYDNFDGNMRNMSKKLYDFLIDEAMNAMLQQLLGVKQMQKLAAALNAGSQKGGFIGAASGIIKGIGSFFGYKFHSGGIVPRGANSQIPGTEEQLALLKGGERILSPGENTNYNSGFSNQKSPVLFNNFNIKAWDSKDVKRCLLENRNLLNTITFQGIKDNHAQLRTMVRNA